MGYDGGYYMMGGMHGLWWVFWVVLLGVLVFSGWGAREASGIVWAKRRVIGVWGAMEQ